MNNQPTNSSRDFQPTLFKNGSGETVPAFGVMRVVETTTPRKALDARKPDGTNEDCTVWINLDIARPNGKTGHCTRDGGCYALFDDSGSAPVPGEEWGPDSDWKLHPDKPGFTIVGGIVGSGATARVRVHPTGGGSGEPGPPGEPGEPGDAGLFRFMLTQDMVRGQGYATANLIDLANEPLGGDAPNWQAATAVTTGLRRRATASVGGFSTGQIIVSTSDRTTGATFDATEAAEWEAAEGDDYQVVVVDQDGKRYGYAGYTDPQFGEQTGWIGTAYFLENDYAGTGYRGFQIVDMEAHARWIEGVTAKDPEDSEDPTNYPTWSAGMYVSPNMKVICPTGAGGLVSGDIIISTHLGSRTATGTFDSTEAAFWKKFATPDATPKDYFFLSVDSHWGAAPNNRPPKTTEQTTDTYEDETYYTVKAYCRLGEDVPAEGDRVRALLDDDQDQYVLSGGEVKATASIVGSYGYLLEPFPACGPDAAGFTPSIVAGAVQPMAFDGSTYEPDGDPINGVNPTGMPIESGIMVPGNIIEIGEPGSETTIFEVQWSDYRNGIPGFTLGNDQSIGHDADGELEHQDDGPCEE
jgi:hypothetical protein